MWVGLGAGYLLPSASFHRILNNLIICETSAHLPCKVWLDLSNEFKKFKPVEAHRREKSFA